MVLSTLLARGRLWRYLTHGTVVATIVLCVAGCKNWETHETLRDSEMAETVRKARPATKEKEINYWSFDDRGRQIERNLAAQNQP